MSNQQMDGGSLLTALLSDDAFRPPAPHSIEETGLSPTTIEALIVKFLGAVGNETGHGIAEQICLPFGILDELYRDMRARQLITHTGSARFNDYFYALTDQGRERAQMARMACAYVGPAPVPLDDYLLSVEAQTVRAETPKRDQLREAFKGISVEDDLFDTLGPAVNSGAGLFLYGSPGNGKTTLAKRITRCFGQDIWIPRTMVEDGQLIKFFDEAYHEPIENRQGSILKGDDHDTRWIKVKRPTVIVGGELTMDTLEIRNDPHSNVSEAPLQLKSNCGVLLIDDFGRQRVEPEELLNRWIIPLENKVDFLTLATGKKFQVPFEQLVIFSTNLEPKDLVDEAFMRRIPYKIEVGDPQDSEFQTLFRLAAAAIDCEYRPEIVEHLINNQYRAYERPMRRCHPRDLLLQVRNYCVYNDLPVEMRIEYFDRVVNSYFTVLGG